MAYCIFVDSDVVISSLLSSSGAAHFVLHHPQIQPVISTVSLQELRIVVARLGISNEKFERLVRDRLEVFTLTQENRELKKHYGEYVSDINDAHIVAGAHRSQVKYLISYNLRHYHRDKIQDKLNVLLLTPALFLQYLRSN